MRVVVGLLGVSLVIASAWGQEDVQIDWLEGPVEGQMSTVSQLAVPEGFVFTGPEGTKVAMEGMGNTVTDTEIGMISSVSNDWIAVFEFDPIGFVKDDEKNDLDADALISSMRESQVEANRYRLERGANELVIDGWFKKPFYNEKTHNLEWCTQLRVKGTNDRFANHNIRILGRYGVTRIVLVADLDQLDTAIPKLAEILESYEYLPGNQYAEYRKGDKIAKYGLTALVAGGAAAVALKSGLFKYIWKGLIIAAVALSSFFKKMFKKSK